MTTFVSLKDIECGREPAEEYKEMVKTKRRREEDEDYDPTVYCICREPDDHRLMIECNACSEWFHAACVGVSKKKASEMDFWVCPICSGEQDPVPGLSSKADSRYVKGKVCLGCGRPAMTDSNACSEECMIKNSEKFILSLAKKAEMKKRRDISTTYMSQKKSSMDDNLDVRKKVRNSLTQCLSPFYEKCEEKNIELEDLVKEIEQALFQEFRTNSIVGDKYRSKFRSLIFNLKRPENERLRQHLFLKEVNGKQLVLMPPEKMASEELEQEIKAIKEESLRQSVLVDQIEGKIHKKTHKGEVEVIQPVQQIDYSNSISDFSASAESLVSENIDTNVTNMSTTNMSITNMSMTNTNSLHSSVSFENNLILESELENDNFVFKGTIGSDENEIPIEGVQVGGPSSLSAAIFNILLSNTRLIPDGRLAVKKALDYLESVNNQSKRNIVTTLLLRPADNSPRNLSRYVAFAEHWSSREKAVVIKQGSQSTFIKDFYIITFDKNISLPSFLNPHSSILSDSVSKIDSDKLLFCTLVHSKVE